MGTPGTTDLARPPFGFWGHCGIGDFGAVDAGKEGEVQARCGAHECHEVALVSTVGHVDDNKLGDLLKQEICYYGAVKWFWGGGVGTE